MSQKKRLLKIAGIVLGVLFLLGFAAFSTLVFSPFEGSYRFDLGALVPRGVDVYASKKFLNQDFERFPRLTAWDSIQGTRAWRAFDGSPEQRDLYQQLGVEQALADLQANLSQLPMGADPLDLFGGKQLVLAVRFAETGDQHEWAVYGRTNWMGKTAVALLGYPSLLNLEAQGLQVESLDKQHHRLSGGQLQQPLHVARVRDVLIVSSGAAFVEEARTLENSGGQDSVLLSAAYHDRVTSAPSATPDDVELMVNLRTTLQRSGITGTWPDTSSVSFAEAFAGRLVQAPAAKNMAGVIGFGGGMSADMEGEFSTELITPFQTRLYRENGFTKGHILEVAEMAPPDTTLLLYLHGPVADLLRQALSSAEPALRQNLEDVFRSTGRWNSLDELIEQIGDAAHDRLCLIVRPQDYGPILARDKDTGQDMSPETDGATVFAFTLITWLRGEGGKDTVDQIREAVGRNPDKFGLQGGTTGSDGYYVYTVRGMDTREFWSPFVPGTGMIATVVDDEQRCYVTNHERMFNQVISCRLGEVPSLADDRTFQALVDSGLPATNLFVWFNPRSAETTLREMATAAARDEVLRNVDWRSQRLREEGRQLPGLFPGRTRNQLSEDQVAQLEDAIDAALEQWKDEFLDQQVPVLVQQRERQLTYLTSARAVMAMLRLDPKQFELALRVLTPLD